MMTCPVCSGVTREHARARIRETYEGCFRLCKECGFLFLEQPVWLAEAYHSPINASDTGYVARNLRCRTRMTTFVETFLNPAGRFLDYAAGYGLFVRLMRDAGYDFRWSDIYCQNLFSRGFEAELPLQGSYEAVTAFEVFEHLVDPRTDLEKISPLTSCLCFSTTLRPEPVPQPADWWYYGLDHGQHVSFYSRRSLEILARDFGFHLATNDSDFHVFTREPISARAFSSLDTRWRRFWLARTRRRPARP